MLKSVWRRWVIACVLIAGLAGCAEINRRGGVTDWAADRFVFRADTKSHRLFRAYVVAGALMTVVRHRPLPEVDRPEFAGQLGAALQVASEAYYCLYPDTDKKHPEANKDILVGTRITWDPTSSVEPVQCLFFDERMARLEYHIYKMAVVALIEPESRKYMAEVGERLFGVKLPVIGQGLKALRSSARAARDTINTVQEFADFIDDLFNLSLANLGSLAHLTPLYRDAVELDMHVVWYSLYRRCAKGDRTRPEVANREPAVLYAAAGPTVVELEEYSPIHDDCELLDKTIQHLRYRDIDVWRSFTDKLNGVLLQRVEAYPVHFRVVSTWMLDACEPALGVKNSAACFNVIEHKKAKDLQFVTAPPNFAKMDVGATTVVAPNADVKQSPAAKATDREKRKKK